MSATETHDRVLFHLRPDDDGYPPVAVEGLWATPIHGHIMRLDSIPFYASGISLGDEIEAERDANGELWFVRLMKPSRNSTFRVVPRHTSNLQQVRNEIESLSCKCEVDESVGLIALSAPGEVSIRPLLNYLVVGKRGGKFDYEEAALRHLR